MQNFNQNLLRTTDGRPYGMVEIKMSRWGGWGDLRGNIKSQVTLFHPVCHLERSRNPRSIERSDNVRGLAALAARILRLMQLLRTTDGRPYEFGLKFRTRR